MDLTTLLGHNCLIVMKCAEDYITDKYNRVTKQWTEDRRNQIKTLKSTKSVNEEQRKRAINTINNNFHNKLTQLNLAIYCHPDENHGVLNINSKWMIDYITQVYAPHQRLMAKYIIFLGICKHPAFNASLHDNVAPMRKLIVEINGKLALCKHKIQASKVCLCGLSLLVTLCLFVFVCGYVLCCFIFIFILCFVFCLVYSVPSPRGGADLVSALWDLIYVPRRDVQGLLDGYFHENVTLTEHDFNGDPFYLRKNGSKINTFQKGGRHNGYVAMKDNLFEQHLYQKITKKFYDEFAKSTANGMPSMTADVWQWFEDNLFKKANTVSSFLKDMASKIDRKIVGLKRKLRNENNPQTQHSLNAIQSIDIEDIRWLLVQMNSAIPASIHTS